MNAEGNPVEDEDEPPLCTLPEELLARLEKADGHINAVRRKLWYETERGLWSGNQAKARLAEIWLWLHGETVEPLPLGHYLKRDVLAERLRVWSFENIPLPPTLMQALDELANAESTIHEQPFPTNMSSTATAETMRALNEGIAREARYEDALCSLMLTIEDILARRYLNLRPGDWLLLPDRKLGWVIWLNGLAAYVFIWRVPMGYPGDAIEGYWFPRAKAKRIPPPKYPPILAPGYYWLTHARDMLAETRRFIKEADLLGLNPIGKALLESLDAAAKAWWITYQPINNGVIWANQSEHHILKLKGAAPSAIADPFIECLEYHRRFCHETCLALPKQLSGWETGMVSTLARLEEGLTGLETLIAPKIDLIAGDWVVSRTTDPIGRLAQRRGQQLVVDLGIYGVIEFTMFHPYVQRIPVPEDFGNPVLGAWHHRWLWFACHPNQTGGRRVCPCCGLPGLNADHEPCELCGWRHDGGDYDPDRMSGNHDDLSLSQGRRRFEALGYAVLPVDENHYLAWMHPLVLARKRLLTEALDAMTQEDRHESFTRLESIEMLRAEYLSLLKSQIQVSASPNQERESEDD